MHTDVSLEQPALLEAVLTAGQADRIILPAERTDPERWKETAGRIKAAGAEAVLALPYVFRNAGEKWLSGHKKKLQEAGFDGFLIRNIDEAGYFAENDIAGKRIFDAGLYTWNHVSAETMRSFGADELTLPYELNFHELQDRGLDGADTLVVYGKIPLMLSAQCTKKNTGGCLKKNGTPAVFSPAYSKLADRKGAVFAEDSRCLLCYTVIYNSVPMWLLDRIPDGISRVRLNFTDETEEETLAVLQAFAERRRPAEGSFTRGHFTRGVE
ncbi:MAG: hypothetical protein IJJ25_09625 [Lachnospiraceae bacterium]|nr:hypothetical protein [Lachnospiraceae bacterium]